MSVDEEYLQTFLRTFSHDASSALRAASGFSKLLAEQYGDNLDEKALHWLSLIGDESEKAQKQLMSLSQYSRLYHVEDLAQHCDFAVICEAAKKEAAVQQALTQFPSVAFEITKLPAIMGNAKAWQQYFTEIFVNAIRYTSPNHAPVLCRVFIEKSDSDVLLVVEDNGVGLTDVDISKAMAPYRSLYVDDQTDEYILSRQGMGLLIAKRIVEVHDGVFSVSKRLDGMSGLRVAASLPMSALCSV